LGRRSSRANLGGTFQAGFSVIVDSVPLKSGV